MVVKVSASSVNPIDYKMRMGELKVVQWGRKPITPGHDFAGEVVEVCHSRRGIPIGARVFGMSPFPKMGAYADYLAVSEDYLSYYPEQLSAEEAAAVPLAALTALQSLRDQGGLRHGRHVLINGASGGVGTFAVQIAKAMSARVTGVCSGRNVDLVRSLGADEVIDYEREDFHNRYEQYDIIFDAVGKSSFFACRPIMRKNGIYINTLPYPRHLAQVAASRFMRQRAKSVWVKPNPADLRVLANYLAQGRIRPVLEKVYPFEELPQAQRDAETERTAGKRVISLSDQF